MNSDIMSFFDEDDNNLSIGTGSSDQGIEPGDEKKEDEFRKNIPRPSQGIEVNEKSNESPDNIKKGKGLVQEGPGPDS